jgi:hypothetical protein
MDGIMFRLVARSSCRPGTKTHNAKNTDLVAGRSYLFCITGQYINVGAIWSRRNSKHCFHSWHSQIQKSSINLLTRGSYVQSYFKNAAEKDMDTVPCDFHTVYSRISFCAVHIHAEYVQFILLGVNERNSLGTGALVIP